MVLDIGFYLEDYNDVYLSSDISISTFDQIIYPTGSGIRNIVQWIRSYSFFGSPITVGQVARIRRLVPKSGSTY